MIQKKTPILSSGGKIHVYRFWFLYPIWSNVSIELFHGETTFPVRNITSPDIHVNTYTRFLLRKLFEVWWSQITRKIRWSITNKKFLIPLKVEGCCHGPIQRHRYIKWFELVSLAFGPRQRHSSNLPLQWVNGTINENV